jgi:putative membrane protein insertion efficiency factor
MKATVIFLIRFYQYTIGTILPPACRFYPTCSEYGIEAIQKYGPLKGGLLLIKRLLRCNPFSRGGGDPLL